MTAPTFPYGYTRPEGDGEQGMGSMRTLAQLVGNRTVALLDPEFRRRVFAVMLYCAEQGVPCGIGTGWRSFAQQQAAYDARKGIGIARPGNSWHQGQSAIVDRNALAVDTVPSSAQRWVADRPEMLRRFGLICFRPSTNPSSWSEPNRRPYSGTREDWHLQPVEIPYGRNYSTAPQTLRHWSIPAQYDVEVIGYDGGVPAQPEPPVVDPPKPPAPPVTVKEITVQFQSIALVKGSSGPHVQTLQRMLNSVAGQGLAIDGDYGDKTVQAVRNVQRVANLTVDGQAGPQTQGWLTTIYWRNGQP